MQKRNYNLAILIGNVLDHYDTHIYVLLAPYIAAAFFPEDLPIISQVKAYGISLVGVITRPLGAALFGRVAGIMGPLKALRYSLIGVALSTFIIGLLPDYSEIGLLAPMLLVIIRALQSIFASGEGAIAGLYLVSSNSGNRGFFSSVYNLSTLSGMLFASFIAETISQTSNPEIYWRVGFILGFATSLAGIYIRSSRYKLSNISVKPKENTLNIIRVSKAKILRIAMLNGFSYITYPIAFTIMNAMIPIVKNIDIASALKLNTYLLILDGVAIPIAGFILNYVRLEKFMIGCALMVVLSTGLLLSSLHTASVDEITLMRVLVILSGLPFSIALKVWTANIMDKCGTEKYLINAIGGGFGIEILGRTIVVMSLFSFHHLGNLYLIMVYVALLSLGAVYSILSYPKS